jgi:hypothetical protein
MNIPDEAVDALIARLVGQGGAIEVVSVPSYFKQEVRAALEQVALPLLADAWDAGLSAGHADRRLNANPYRRTK